MYGLHVFTVYQSLNRAQERTLYAELNLNSLEYPLYGNCFSYRKMCLILITSYNAKDTVNTIFGGKINKLA